MAGTTTEQSPGGLFASDTTTQAGSISAAAATAKSKFKSNSKSKSNK